MRYPIKRFLFTGLSMIATIPAQAQSTGPDMPDVAGGSRKISGITHEFAIGQVIDGDAYGSGLLVVTPGVLQPAARIKNTGDQIGANELQIFPDPVVSTLYLLPAFGRGGTLRYALYDAAGSLITSREVVLKNGSERQDLPVSHIAAGQYFLKVSWIVAGEIPNTSGYKIQKMW